MDCDDIIVSPDPCDCDFDFEPVCVEVEEGVIIPFPNACIAECEGYTADDFVDCDDNSPAGLGVLPTQFFETPTLQPEKDNELNIVENPVKHTLTMNFELLNAEVAALKINIISIGGELKSSQAQQATAGNNQIQIDVSHLKSGIYVLQVQSKNEVKTLKFIK